MELAEGYATLARGGVHRPATIIIGEAPSAAIIPEPALAISLATSPGILRRSSCLQALQCLAAPERTRRIYPDAADLAPAWKTGTSSGHRDAWCAAVTPRRTVVVWLGNTDGSGSDALVGQDAAAPLALRLIKAVDAPRGDALASFAPPPDFLTHAQPASAKIQPGKLSQLTMLSPVDHEKILLDASLPADQRRVALRARMIGGDDPQLWWMIDSQCVGVCQSSDVLWWNPVAGQHEIRVINAQGQAAIATVEVGAVISPR